MNAPTPPHDAERELNDLRRRAYGPHPDIETDPAALARLRELEAARTPSPPDSAAAGIRPPAAAAADASAADAWTEAGDERFDPAIGEGPPRPLWDRLRAPRARRRLILAGALVALIALGYTVAGLAAPRPDATLRPIADEADSVVLNLLDFLGTDTDRSTLRGYQQYRGFQPWFSVEINGMRCFMLVDRSTSTVDGANCVPPGVDLFADVGAWPMQGDNYTEGLPDGSLIRFHHRENSVEVFVYPAPGAE